MSFRRPSSPRQLQRTKAQPKLKTTGVQVWVTLSSRLHALLPSSPTTVGLRVSLKDDSVDGEVAPPTEARPGLKVDANPTVESLCASLCVAFSLFLDSDTKAMLLLAFRDSSGQWVPLGRHTRLSSYSSTIGSPMRLHLALATEPEYASKSTTPPSVTAVARTESGRALALVPRAATRSRPFLLSLQYTSSELTANKKMLVDSGALVSQTIALVADKFGISDVDISDFCLFAQHPFNVELRPEKPLSHYRWLDGTAQLELKRTPDTVHIRVMTESAYLSPRAGAVSAGTPLEVKRTILLSDLLVQLISELQVSPENPAEWAVVGKHRESAKRYFLAETARLEEFLGTFSMDSLVLKRKDATTRQALLEERERQQRKEGRTSIAVRTSDRAPRCCGANPDTLDQCEDYSVTVPVCLAQLRRALVAQYGIQTEGLFIAPTDGGLDRPPNDELTRLWTVLDAGRPLGEGEFSLCALSFAVWQYYSSLPTRIFSHHPLSKLQKAATSYQASMLMAAQLPQRPALLLGWLVRLLTEIVLNADVNGATRQRLAEYFAPALVNGAEAGPDVVRKVVAFVTTLINDKVEETVERQGMVSSYNSEGIVSSSAHSDRASVAGEAAVGGASVGISDWSVTDVADWCRSLAEYNLEHAGWINQVADALAFEEIDGETLAEVRMEDMAALGVEVPERQQLFITAVEQLVAAYS
jgi:hypothetical protein